MPLCWLYAGECCAFGVKDQPIHHLQLAQKCGRDGGGGGGGTNHKLHCNKFITTLVHCSPLYLVLCDREITHIPCCTSSSVLF